MCFSHIGVPFCLSLPLPLSQKINEKCPRVRIKEPTKKQNNSGLACSPSESVVSIPVASPHTQGGSQTPHPWFGPLHLPGPVWQGSLCPPRGPPLGLSPWAPPGLCPWASGPVSVLAQGSRPLVLWAPGLWQSSLEEGAGPARKRKN